MSINNQDSLVKEIKDLLESSQKEALREINTERNFFAKIFGSDKKNNLKQIQSNISKALNQLTKVRQGDSELVSRLQANLNDKSAALKKLEEQSGQANKKLVELQSKVEFYEQELNHIKSHNTNVESEQVANIITSDTQKITEEFKVQIEALEKSYQDVESRFKASQEDLYQSQELSVELANRIKRIKSEITSK